MKYLKSIKHIHTHTHTHTIPTVKPVLEATCIKVTTGFSNSNSWKTKSHLLYLLSIQYPIQLKLAHTHWLDTWNAIISR